MKTENEMNTDDYTRYEQALEETRDEEGIVYRDKAVEKLTAYLLSDDPTGIEDFFRAWAQQVAEAFDERQEPQVEQGELHMDMHTYLILGDNERIRVDRAKAVHTTKYLDRLNSTDSRSEK